MHGSGLTFLVTFDIFCQFRTDVFCHVPFLIGLGAVFRSCCFTDAKKIRRFRRGGKGGGLPLYRCGCRIRQAGARRAQAGKGESGGFVFEGELDVGFGGFRGFFQAQLDLLLLAQEVAPVAFFIPVAPVQLDGVLDALAAVAALQIVFAAIFVAPPADALGIFGEYGEFFRHDMCLVFLLDEIIGDAAATVSGLYVFYAQGLRFVKYRMGRFRYFIR